MEQKRKNEFTKEVKLLINRLSLENYLDMPDGVLAKHLTGCLLNLENTLRLNRWKEEQNLTRKYPND